MSETQVLKRSHMPRAMRRELLNRYCRLQESVLWGEKRLVTPVLLPVVYGDGRQIIAIRPIVSRLSHYIIAGDSAWHLNDDDGLRAHLDAIYRDIQSYFGKCRCGDCRHGGDVDRDVFAQWPTPCFSIGTEWWREGTDGGRGPMKPQEQEPQL